MVNRFKFGKEKIEALPSAAAGSRATCYDTEIPKLALRITPSGTKTFYVIKRTDREMVWFKLGVFPDMTVEQARKEAQKSLAAFASDHNPAEIRRAQKQEPTFGEMFTEYGKRHGINKRSWTTDQSIYANHLQSLASRKLTTISRAIVSRILSDLEREGKSGATINNVRALISSIYGRAIEWGYATTNPVTGIRTRAKIKRDRFLQAEELPRFFRSLAEEQNETLRDYILLALLTGARRANLLAMRWTEINLSERVWRIPDTKNGTPQNVTLSPEAVTILETRKDAAENGAAFVFPGIGRSGHIEEPKKAVIRVMERAGIPYGRNTPEGVTLHDLRRTLGSWQAKTGASLAIIGKSLNHKSLQATAIYARLDLDPVRASVNTATSAMLEAAGLKNAADVVELPKRGAV
ncbi:MAG TPA: site-specific integrase [Candidatus Accumulibacter phosphatis]|nr:site-specific integrase [Candidatus Accumulibacter phosphatis]